MDAKEAVKQEQQLIKDVFSTDAGQKLLTRLAHQYIWSKQLTGDVNDIVDDVLSDFIQFDSDGKAIGSDDDLEITLHCKLGLNTTNPEYSHLKKSSEQDTEKLSAWKNRKAKA